MHARPQSVVFLNVKKLSELKNKQTTIIRHLFLLQYCFVKRCVFVCVCGVSGRRGT